MSVNKRLSDLASSNTIKQSVTVITNGQAWTRQIRGTYSLVYTYAQADFLHLKDFNQFLQKSYAPHTHGNGRQGAPTTRVLEPSQVTNAEAQALLQAAGPIGKIRQGISDALASIDFIDQTNSEDLG